MLLKQNYQNIIIGAGIAGLTAAYKLHKQGEEFLLIDSADRVGGNWSSRAYKDSIYEFGPNTLMNRCDEINKIIEELGIQDQVLTEKFKDSVRYLYLDSRFYKIGSNPLKLLLSGILSPWGIIRAAIEPLIARRSVTTPRQSPNQSTEDESVFDFISRRFGKEIAERLVQHALQGIWAGDIRQLSAKVALKNLVQMEEEYGSVIKAVILSPKDEGSQEQRKRSFANAQDDDVNAQDDEKKPLASISFKKGMQYLTQVIADSLPKESILLGTGVTSLQSNPYIVKLQNGEELQAENLMIATKAFQAGALLEESAAGLSSLLKQIYYAPVFLLAFSIPKKLFKNKKPKGFGYISGARDHFILGTIFSSELYPERNLEDEYLFTCFLGGLKNPQILDFTEGDLILKAIAEQKEVFSNAYGIELKDSDFNVVDHKLIDKAIPQYNLGFSDLKNAIDKELGAYPGLTLLGNYLEGVSIPDTVLMSLRASKRRSNPCKSAS